VDPPQAAACALGGVLEGAVLAPLRVLCAALACRVVRVLRASAPHVHDAAAAEHAGRAAGAAASPSERWHDVVAAFAAHVSRVEEGQGGVEEEGEDTGALLTRVVVCGERLQAARAAASGAAAALGGLREREAELSRALRRLEFEREGDFRAVSSGGGVAEAYVPITPPAESRAALLEALTGVLPSVGLLATQSEGEAVAAAWRAQWEALGRRVAPQVRQAKGWEGRARAVLELLGRAAEGARTTLGALEGLLAMEKGRPDMRGLLAETDGLDAALLPLASQYHAALVRAAGRRRELAECRAEAEALRARAAALEAMQQEGARAPHEVGGG
jgi:hypothetical protein